MRAVFESPIVNPFEAQCLLPIQYPTVRSHGPENPPMAAIS
jgi:hypothetical protein